MLNWPNKYAHKGDEVRKKAIKEYQITPIFHGVLLPNQIRSAYFKQIITTNYYCFKFTPINSNNDTGYFYCGDDAAKKWLILLGENPLPLFNPLSVNNAIEERSPAQNIQLNPKKTKHPIRKDLLVILNTLIALFDIKDDSSAIPQVLQRIMSVSDLTKIPENRDIKAVNTILFKIIVLSGKAMSYHDYINRKGMELHRNFKRINHEELNRIINSFENTNPASF